MQSAHDNYESWVLVSGASPPPRQPRQLPWLIFETIIYYKKWPKQLGRFQEKNIQAKKLLKYTVSFCRIEKMALLFYQAKNHL